MNIIFYHPGNAFNEKTINRGSQIRPIEMFNAFKELGHEVTLVDGPKNIRKRQISVITRRLEQGESFDLLYIENSNKPNSLTGEAPYPQDILMEFKFLKKLKEHGTYVALFYRDLYWRFDIYNTMLPFFKRNLALPFYYLDLLTYRSYIDTLYLPSIELASHFPFPICDSIRELPPGSKNDTVLNNEPIDTLRLLYVGGITPPLYDITKMLDSVKSLDNVELIVCCRKEEWEAQKNNTFIPNNTSIVHVSGEKLKTLFNTSDIFLDVRPNHEYLDLCMPIKLFEALNFELPIITSTHTKMSEFVRKNKIGWTVSNTCELSNLIESLSKEKKSILTKSKQCKVVKNSNTWARRAQHVIDSTISSKFGT